MSIDNTLKVKSFLSFEKDDFYFIQIIKRRKDNPDMELGSVILKNYYINSFEEYDKLIPIIQRQCDFENARAYIRLNKRNYKHLGLRVINRALVYVTSNNNKPLCNVFDSVAGECPSDPVRKWVVDVDNENITGKTPYKFNSDGIARFDYGESEIAKLCSFIQMLQSQTKNEPMMEFLPTKNGMHIITRPFNMLLFKKEYPKFDAHRDATTILYCP